METESIVEFLRDFVIEEQSQPELPRVFDDTNDDETWTRSDEANDPQDQPDAQEVKDNQYTTAVFEPILTPPQTPPASLFTTAMCGRPAPSAIPSAKVSVDTLVRPSAIPSAEASDRPPVAQLAHRRKHAEDADTPETSVYTDATWSHRLHPINRSRTTH